MDNVWLYIIGSVCLVSILSLIGVATLGLNEKKLRKILLYLVSFSAGALLGDAFIHLLPEIVTSQGFTLTVSLLVLGGIVLFFLIEKIVHWQHCHLPQTEEHVHPFAITNLIGDGVHNFIDGIIIAASYLVSLPVGFATTLAVIFHEIPQEIGDFGVLMHGGFSKSKALFYNFLTAIMAVLGAGVTLLASNSLTSISSYLLPIAVGGFIYIASSDLIPELHKEFTIKKSIVEIATFIAGILVMLALLRFG
jgi:zinc and cadmium transporter